MGRCKVVFKDLKNFQKKMNNLREERVQQFIEVCAKELAARLLAKVIKRTPVGVYDKPVKFISSDGKEVSFKPNTGKKGGTLRRGWTAKTEAEAQSGGKGDVVAYTQSLTIQKIGHCYQIEVVNPVSYASYVEFGHRTTNHKGWVEGCFMLTISEQELEADAPRVIENKLERYLGECFS